jgi:predicted transcriptional regulator
MKPLTIGKLSNQTGCNIETIRYYERIGLLRSAGVGVLAGLVAITAIVSIGTLLALVMA